MRSNPLDASDAYRWRLAWSEYEESELEGIQFYELPNGTTIYNGDRFWDDEERVVLKVFSVKTKVFTGTVGPAGEEGDDYVFFERDWKPPRTPEMRHRPRSNFYTSAKQFAEALDEGTLVPHRGNGVRLPP